MSLSEQDGRLIDEVAKVGLDAIRARIDIWIDRMCDAHNRETRKAVVIEERKCPVSS